MLVNQLLGKEGVGLLALANFHGVNNRILQSKRWFNSQLAEFLNSYHQPFQAGQVHSTDPIAGSQALELGFHYVSFSEATAMAREGSPNRLHPVGRPCAVARPWGG